MKTIKKQSDIARGVGITDIHLSYVINRKRQPSWLLAKKLGAATGSDPVVWMDGSALELKQIILNAKHQG
ncbi:MAG: hypothetical protein GY841_12375 [FCB group bacterium]|nr:hypothetical protein [FCB group bacterium]